LTIKPFHGIIDSESEGNKMEWYMVEWTYKKNGYYYTDKKHFDTETEQQKFAFEKFHEENVTKVCKISEIIWEKD
jgi:hypothetical protein